MNKPIKTKLCWNCEGNVSRSAENCPYCAVYLNPDSEDIKEQTTNIKAPYSLHRETNGEVPKAPYSLEDSQEDDRGKIQESTLPNSGTNFQTIFLPLIFLTTGLISLFFALLLFLFSEKGKLTLQWDGDSWYIYALLALPLLFFGWRCLEKDSD